MNKSYSYLDKTKHYLPQLEIDFDVRLQEAQEEVEAFKVTLQLVVMKGEMRTIWMGFYSTAEWVLLIYLIEKLCLIRPIQTPVSNKKGFTDLLSVFYFFH